MNCNEADEMMGAYALDALPPNEIEAMRAHIATCPAHAAAVAELRAVAARLPALVDAMPAPAALRSRVLAAITAEQPSARVGVVTPLRPSRRAPATPTADSRPPTATSTRTAAATMRRLPTYAWGSIAAVFVAAIAGLLVWNIVLQNRLDSRGGADQLAQHLERSVPLRADDAANGGGTVVFFPDERRAVVLGERLPQPAAGKTYQMWKLGSERPVSLGLLQIDSTGRGTAVVGYDSDRPAALAITIEPEGGSTQPTTQPVLRAQPQTTL